MNIFTKYTKQELWLRAVRVVQVLIAAFLVVMITPTKSSFKYEFSLGQYWRGETLTAPFDFAVLKSNKELQKEKEEISANKKLYFDYSTDANEKMESSLNEQISSLEHKKNLKHTESILLETKCRNILNNIINHGIVSEYQGEETNSKSIIVVENNIASEHEIGEYYNIKDIETIVKDNITKNIGKTELVGEIGDIMTKVITPNIIYNDDKTNEVLKTQIDDISPTKGLITKNQKIISKGETINAEKYQILSSLKSKYEGNAENAQTGNKILALFGQYLLIVIALGAMVLFLYNTDKDIFLNNKKIILIYCIILLMVGATVGVLHINQEYLYIVPLCLTPILVRTFFDTKTALYVFLVSIIVIGFSVPNSFEFVFYQLIAGMMAILSVEHLEKRSEFFNTALVVFGTYSAIYLSMTLIQGGDFSQIDYHRFVYFGFSAAMILFAFPIVYVFEKLFSMVSEMSLLEYSNTDSKILRELSVKAPGTFQHCIQVANIAEDLTHVIGGNALLVRAGALYHDIGKIVNPMYFTENQNTGFNPHDELTNAESAQIIISHITDGIKIAHRYKIPEPIVDFIRSHHGTRKTNYFYNKECNEHPDMQIDESIFSYNGPKPFSRETAVLMMVDSVEAASRSLKDHSEESIGRLVDGIIDSQIKDNQFSNANITFADVEKVKTFLKKKLQSIYHVRVQYPVNKVNKG